MRPILRPAALWGAFSLLVAALVYGFVSGGLLSQEIWYAVGLERLKLLAGFYAAWFLVISVWRRSLFVPGTVFVAGMYTVASVGLSAVAAVLLLLLSSVVLGMWLLGEEQGGEVHAISDGVALLAGLSLYIWIVGLLVHFPVNYPFTYLLLFATPLLWKRGATAAVLRRWALALRPAALSGRVEHALLGLVIFLFVCHWLVVLKPETSGDGLAMHLAIAAWVGNFHQWHFDAQHVVWAVMPMGGDWAFTAAYLLGGEYASRLLNFSLLVLTAVLLFGVVRHWTSRVAGLLVVALFATTPVTQLVTGSLFVENVWAALLFGAVVALWRHREEGRTVWLYAAALLAGTALASKLGALPFAASMGFFAAWDLGRRRNACGAVVAVMVAAIFLVTASPPYLTAWLKTGNPVFPFMNAVFKSPYFEASTSFVDHRFTAALGPGTLYDITFRTHKYMEGQDGAWGFHYFLFLPLAILSLRRDWPYIAKVSLAVGIISSILTFQFQSNLRYLYPALPMFLVAISLLFSKQRASAPALRGILAGTGGAVVFLNLYFLPSSSWYHKEFFLNTAFGGNEVEEYVKIGAPTRKLIEYLNLRIPGNPVGFVESNHIAGLQAKAYTSTWHNDSFTRRLRTATSSIECLRLMNELGIRYFVAPTKESGIFITDVPLEVFLDDLTTPEYTFGSYHIARLRDEHTREHAPEDPGLLERGLAPSPPGVYDDTSQFVSYFGRWWRDTQFREAFNGTLTYTNEAGASFRLAFRGTEVVYVYTRSHNRGMAAVSIDGADKGKIDLYSPQTEWRARTRIGGLPEGNHVLVIRVLSEKNPESEDFYVDLDSLEVR